MGTGAGGVGSMSIPPPAGTCWVPPRDGASRGHEVATVQPVPEGCLGLRAFFWGGRILWCCSLMLAGFVCLDCSSQGDCCGQPQPEEKVSHHGGTGSVWQLGLRRCQNAAQHMGAGRWEKKSRLRFWIRLYLLPQGPWDPHQRHFPIPSAPSRPAGPCPHVPTKGSCFVTTTAPKTGLFREAGRAPHRAWAH